MKVGTDLVAKVEGDSGVDAVGKGPLEIGILLLEVAKGVVQLPEKLGRTSSIRG